MYIYKTTGVCSKQIEFHVEESILKEVKFYAGCPGSLQGISRLISGMHIDDAIEKLHGITCSGKNTSCPDQLTKALMLLKEQIA